MMDVVQTPLTQDCPLAHAFPHVPQLLVSVWGLMHVPAHESCPVPQPIPVVQVPETQGCPLAQAVPHVPQFEGSDDGVVQNLPHKVPGQVSVSVADCILYSTNKLTSAPRVEAHVDPVRSNVWSVAPAANVNAMGPLSDQYCPGLSTKS